MQLQAFARRISLQCYFGLRETPKRPQAFVNAFGFCGGYNTRVIIESEHSVVYSLLRLLRFNTAYQC